MNSWHCTRVDPRARFLQFVPMILRYFGGARRAIKTLQPEQQAPRVDAQACDGCTGVGWLLIPGSNGNLSAWDSPWFSLWVTNSAIYERDDARAWVISNSEALAVPPSLNLFHREPVPGCHSKMRALPTEKNIRVKVSALSSVGKLAARRKCQTQGARGRPDQPMWTRTAWQMEMLKVSIRQKRSKWTWAQRTHTNTQWSGD